MKSQASVAKKKLLRVPHAALNQSVSQPIVAFKRRKAEREDQQGQPEPANEMDRLRRPEPAFARDQAHRHEYGDQLDEPDQDVAWIALTSRAL